MIDWHSHILPSMDDGSRNIQESLSLVAMQKSQGVDTVIATPHFYANDETLESFLSRRRAAFEALSRQLPADSPQIRLGAEVRYYAGISRMQDLAMLKIEGSRALLLEMSVSEWTEYTVRELCELAGKGNIKIILAHIERYYALQKRSVWDRLLDCGILMQVNAGFFASLSSRHKAISFLRDGTAHFIGSDCHNLTSRPPRIGKAYEIIQKKFGDRFVSQMDDFGHSLLG